MPGLLAITGTSRSYSSSCPRTPVSVSIAGQGRQSPRAVGRRAWPLAIRRRATAFPRSSSISRTAPCASASACAISRRGPTTDATCFLSGPSGKSQAKLTGRVMRMAKRSLPARVCHLTVGALSTPARVSDAPACRTRPSNVSSTMNRCLAIERRRVGRSVRRFLVIASVESSPGTTYADSRGTDEAALMATRLLQASIFKTGFESMDERLQLLSQTVGSLADPHPTPSPDLVFEPVFELRGHPHDVNIDAEEVVALRVAIAADRFARDNASETCFLLSFTDRRLARAFAIVNRPFGKNPTLAGRSRDQRDLDALLPDSIRNHRRLVMYARHGSSVTTCSGACAQPICRL